MNWLDLVITQTAPVLPSVWALQWSRAAAWAVVLACAGAVLTRRQSSFVRVAISASLAVWACAPGEWSPTFWLGLAFQSPSLLGCLLCLYGAAHRSLGEAASVEARFLNRLAWVGVALGYLLLLDTLALLPVQIYAWGFGPSALLAALAVALLPWVAGVRGWLVWAAPLSLLLFALTRLPSGNVWDALLDPITWVGLHLVRFRARAR